jgi:hypothetical protein
MRPIRAAMTTVLRRLRAVILWEAARVKTFGDSTPFASRRSCAFVVLSC